MSPRLPYCQSKRSLREIEDEKNVKGAAISYKKRMLLPKRSFDAEFWLDTVHVAQLQLHQAQLHFEKIEVEFMSSGKGGLIDFLKTEEAKKTEHEIKGFEVHLRMCQKQAD